MRTTFISGVTSPWYTSADQSILRRLRFKRIARFFFYHSRYHQIAYGFYLEASAGRKVDAHGQSCFNLVQPGDVSNVVDTSAKDYRASDGYGSDIQRLKVIGGRSPSLVRKFRPSGESPWPLLQGAGRDVVKNFP